jgi:hypothetical protein
MLWVEAGLSFCSYNGLQGKAGFVLTLKGVQTLSSEDFDLGLKSILSKYTFI